MTKEVSKLIKALSKVNHKSMVMAIIRIMIEDNKRRKDSMSDTMIEIIIEEIIDKRKKSEKT